MKTMHKINNVLRKDTFMFSCMLLLCISLMFFPSCKKDNSVQPSPDMGYSYFPGKVGNYVIYNVDSIVHDKFTGTVDTFRFQVKELIDSVIYDNTDRPTWRIAKYKRNYNDTVGYNSLPWQFQYVLAENLTNTDAERLEDNQRYVKLVFPVVKNKTWNGNALNTMGEWDYSYLSVDTPATYGGMHFDSTLTVLQRLDTNLIQWQYYVEVYARHVGMVYKQIIDVTSDSIKPGVPVLDRISSGIEYKATIESYGTQ